MTVYIFTTESGSTWSGFYSADWFNMTFMIKIISLFGDKKQPSNLLSYCCFKSKWVWNDSQISDSRTLLETSHTSHDWLNPKITFPQEHHFNERRFYFLKLNRLTRKTFIRQGTKFKKEKFWDGSACCRCYHSNMTSKIDFLFSPWNINSSLSEAQTKSPFSEDSLISLKHTNIIVPSVFTCEKPYLTLTFLT